ncbi:uncharacterized protein LOC108291560 isoform X1 [Cebus imitator]|uniref:Uncharacterized protein LOC116537997 n=1 Tax=Sapajus apella TaxID=9515 RepID=A0A6J3GDL5_SAPAP|nr:uncharacterized protein LOC108291560 isoform X1 [Cebus imitator]XP_032116138.1 uncharacterized protein LOC116537997 [Sapajus apella]
MVQNVKRCYTPSWGRKKVGSAGPCSCHQVPAPRYAGSEAGFPLESEGSPVPASLPEGLSPHHPASSSGRLQDPGTLHQHSWRGCGHRRLLFQENTIISQRL